MRSQDLINKVFRCVTYSHLPNQWDLRDVGCYMLDVKYAIYDHIFEMHYLKSEMLYKCDWIWDIGGVTCVM